MTVAWGVAAYSVVFGVQLALAFRLRAWGEARRRTAAYLRCRPRSWVTPLYLPVLRLLEPRLLPGAVVLADDLALFPDALRAYLEHVRDPARGYESVEVPVGDGMELSVRSV